MKGNIWSVDISEKVNTEWPNNMKNEIKLNGKERITITKKMVRKQSKKTSNWKMQ